MYILKICLASHLDFHTMDFWRLGEPACHNMVRVTRARDSYNEEWIWNNKQRNGKYW